MNNSKPFGEVIESSLSGFIAQSWQWNTFPSFGSVVGIEQGTRTIIGIVHQVQTGSSDPSRQPFAYQKTEEELLAEQPQIFEFLKTTFSCITIGYVEKGHIYYTLAPQPPKIHSFVASLEQDLCKRFFYTQQCLPLIFNNANIIFNLDELLLALLKHLAQLEMINEQKIVQFMDHYLLLTGNDYRRTKLFLQRASNIITI